MCWDCYERYTCGHKGKYLRKSYCDHFFDSEGLREDQIPATDHRYKINRELCGFVSVNEPEDYEMREDICAACKEREQRDQEDPNGKRPADPSPEPPCQKRAVSTPEQDSKRRKIIYDATVGYWEKNPPVT